MKEGESQNIFNKRARKLISKAFVRGMDPEEIKVGMRTARRIAKERGRERITRGELSHLMHTGISQGFSPTGGWWEL